MAAAWLLVLAAVAIDTAPADCDNIAGTCLRQRQQAALVALAGLCAAAALCCGWIGRRAALGRPIRTVHTAVLVAAVLVLVAVALVDPAGHLDNSRHGWLSPIGERRRYRWNVRYQRVIWHHDRAAFEDAWSRATRLPAAP